MEPPLLELVHATVFRDDTPVLDDVTLTMHAGEHTAIVGPNGAGKSSFIRLFTLESYPAVSPNGTPPLRILGQERWDVADLRARVSVVSADLHTQFTTGTWVTRVRGLEAVLSGFFGSHAVFDHHVVTPEMTARAEEALGGLGAAQLANKRLDHMSTGEARRVLIARALVHTPEVLVLDEPTTGLDVVARSRFMEHVRGIARGGTTIVLVTQHIDEIFPEVGRVVLLHGGRIVEDGPKDRVLRGRRLEEVFGAPLTVETVGGYYHVRPAQ